MALCIDESIEMINVLTSELLISLVVSDEGTWNQGRDMPFCLFQNVYGNVVFTEKYMDLCRSGTSCVGRAYLVKEI